MGLIGDCPLALQDDRLHIASSFLWTVLAPMECRATSPSGYEWDPFSDLPTKALAKFPGHLAAQCANQEHPAL